MLSLPAVRVWMLSLPAVRVWMVVSFPAVRVWMVVSLPAVVVWMLPVVYVHACFKLASISGDTHVYVYNVYSLGSWTEYHCQSYSRCYAGNLLCTKRNRHVRVETCPLLFAEEDKDTSCRISKSITDSCK